MEALIVIGIFTVILFYKNKNWLEYMWKEHMCKPYEDVVGYKEPPFCFDCDCAECEDCNAYKAWKIDPDKGWKVWEEMKKRRSYKY